MGGKSRKSGGVSKKLIMALKAEGGAGKSKKCNNGNKIQENPGKGLFDDPEE